MLPLPFSLSLPVSPPTTHPCDPAPPGPPPQAPAGVCHQRQPGGVSAHHWRHVHLPVFHLGLQHRLGLQRVDQRGVSALAACISTQLNLARPTEQNHRRAVSGACDAAGRPAAGLACLLAAPPSRCCSAALVQAQRGHRLWRCQPVGQRVSGWPPALPAPWPHSRPVGYLHSWPWASGCQCASGRQDAVRA